MRGITRMENGKEVEYVNSELIPGFLYLPREVMDCFPTEVRNLSRRIPDLLYDQKTIAVVESSLFTNSVSAGFSILSWLAMGQPEQTPESYSEYDPAYLISMTASLWITGLEFIRILPDAVEWKAMHQNVDKSFGYPTMDQAMLYMYALVPRLMVILHIDQAIQIAREFPCHEDFSKVSSTQKRDFLRKWNHSRAKTAVLSLESLQQDAENSQSAPRWEPPDMESSIEEEAVDHVLGEEFLATLSARDRQLLVLRNMGYSQAEIAEKLGFQTHSAVQKRIKKLGQEFEAFSGTCLGFGKKKQGQ